MEILIDDASPQFEYVSAGQQPQGLSGTWHNAYQSEGQYGPGVGVGVGIGIGATSSSYQRRIGSSGSRRVKADTG